MQKQPAGKNNRQAVYICKKPTSFLCDLLIGKLLLITLRLFLKTVKFFNYFSNASFINLQIIFMLIRLHEKQMVLCDFL